MRYHLDGGDPTKDRCLCGNLVLRGETPCRACVRDKQEKIKAQEDKEYLQRLQEKYCQYTF